MSAHFALAIETSTPHASLTVVRPDGTFGRREFRSDRNHNAMLFKPLHELLHDAGRREPELVLVGSGPGSYSGTRVGIAAAQGVAIAVGCPAVAVPSILAVPCAETGAPCLAIGDARRGSYWSARIEHRRLAGEPALCDAQGLESLVGQAVADGFTVFSFEQADRFPLPKALGSRVLVQIPDARLLWLAWMAADAETRNAWSADLPQPIYLKPPHITPARRASLLRS